MSDSEIDFLKFQINELENSNLRIGEKGEIRVRDKLFENYRSILENLSKHQNLSIMVEQTQKYLKLKIQRFLIFRITK